MSQKIKFKIIKNPTTSKKDSFITIPSPAELEKVEETTVRDIFVLLLFLLASSDYFSF